MEDANSGNDNQSDSDTSESWTFVDSGIANVDDQQDSVVTSSQDADAPESNPIDCGGDEGDSVDGVAVISDDEDVSSSSAPVSLSPDNPSLLPRDSLFSPASRHGLHPATSSTTSLRDSEEELPEDFFLSEKKVKSYIHRRNNKVSSLLNAVLMGTVVTAMTLAAGFMWGINDTCSIDMLNSVNKILDNMQKLQLENDILKTKLKMLQMPRGFMHKLNHYPQSDHFEHFPHDTFQHNLFGMPPNSQHDEATFHNVNDILDYENLEFNENIKPFTEAENGSQQREKFSEKPNIVPQMSRSPVIGPKTYDQYLVNKQHLQNTCHSSEESEMRKPNKHNRKDKLERKLKKSKREMKKKMDRFDSFEDENSQNVNRLKKEKDDWYQKLHHARQDFRNKGTGDYNFIKSQNKAKWYFKRMNERAKTRQNKINTEKRYQKEYFTGKQ